MAVLQISRNMGAGVGYAVDLGGKNSYVEIEAGADMWCRVTEAVEAAPSATPAPGTNASASWVHLANAGDKVTFDFGRGLPALNQGRGMTHVLIWSIGAGVHTITGPGV